jgi:predicted RNase H-like HicB family nuclease
MLIDTQDAIRLWRDVATEHGDPIPEPQGRKVMAG